MTEPAAPLIWVLAGTNGAGKSSIGGVALRHQQSDYFNPDEAAGRIRTANPGLSQDQASVVAWHQGKRLLETAIAQRKDFYFETTLGGKTMTSLLEQALDEGFEVHIWYAGLDTPERHIARVEARVEQGGHSIPPNKIRHRYDTSRENLIRLLPRLTELQVYDNSEEADPASGGIPAPRLVLHLSRGKIVALADLSATPRWAKPIVAKALKLPGPP